MKILVAFFHNTAYLKNIYIYPDNRAGVNGLYFDDIYIQDGQYKLGDNAYINLYNAQRLNSVDKIASDAFLNSTNLMHIRIDKAPNTIEGAPWGAISWDRAVEWLRPAE